MAWWALVWVADGGVGERTRCAAGIVTRIANSRAAAHHGHREVDDGLAPKDADVHHDHTTNT